MTLASPAPGQAGRRMWQFQAAAPSDVTNGCDSPAFRHQTSEKARRLQAEIKRVARFPFNILITGETGTGKTMAASASRRPSPPAR